MITGSPIASLVGPSTSTPFDLPFAKRAALILHLPTADSTGKINLGSWEDARVDDVLLADHEGIFRAIPGGTVPFQHARIAQNLKIGGDPNDFDTGYSKVDLSVSTGFADPLGGTDASKLTIVDATNSLDKWNNNAHSLTGEFINSCWVRAVSGTVTGNLRGPNGSTHRSFTVSESWVRIATTVQNPHPTTWIQEGFFNLDGDLYVYCFQSEDVTDRAIQTPSELVSSLAYYATTNGNTVDGSGVVTEAVGAALSPVPTMVHYDASENYFLNSDAPVTQTIDFTALGTGDYTLSVYGTGTVTSADVGATGTGHGAASDGTDITFNLSVVGTVSFTVAGGPPDYVQVEKKAFSTVPIVTAGTSVTRDACIVRHPLAGRFNQAGFTVVCDFESATAQASFTTTDEGLVSVAESATNLLFIDSGGLQSADGTTTAIVDPTLLADTKWRAVVHGVEGGDFQVSEKDLGTPGAWAHGTPAAYDGAFTSGSWINLGYGCAHNLTFYKVDIYSANMTTDQIEALA
jgi:hypothetical protein